jgi:hypothetical protein
MQTINEKLAEAAVQSVLCAIGNDKVCSSTHWIMTSKPVGLSEHKRLHITNYCVLTSSRICEIYAGSIVCIL